MFENKIFMKFSMITIYNTTLHNAFLVCVEKLLLPL
jgi:hypothetical protein